MDEKAIKAILDGIPAPLRGLLLGAVVAGIVLIMVFAVLRVARGGALKLPWFGEIGSTKELDELRAAVEDLNQDAKLKRNVLVTLRRRLDGARRLMVGKPDPDEVRAWVQELLIEAASIISRGHHDRHRAALWIPAESSLLRMYAAVGFRDEAVRDARLKNPGSKASEAMQLRRTVNVADITAEPGFEPKTRTSSPDYYALLVVPVILNESRVFGVICLDAEAKGYFTEDDEFFVQCMADAAAVVLSRLE